MRVSTSAFIPRVLLALRVPVVVLGGHPGASKGLEHPDRVGHEKSPDSPASTTSMNGFGASVRATASIVASSPSSLLTTASDTRIRTTTETIDVSSFMAFSVSSLTPSASSGAVSSTSTRALSSSESTSDTQQVMDNNDHRNLVIILASVLSFAGFLSILGLILLYRHRQGRNTFGRRGASPINDDEIASWRINAQEKQSLPQPDHGPAVREVSLYPCKSSPAWTWAASPSSIRTVNANGTTPLSSPKPALSPSPSPRPFHEARGMNSVYTANSPGWTWNSSPVSLSCPASAHSSRHAQAPNARAGLTTETVPGEDPFIPIPKRQISRLSKLPPGHSRTKSRRSSLSGKSMGSNHGRSSSDLRRKDSSIWFDQDEENIDAPFGRMDNGSSSPGTSVFDELAAVSGGGLSPRPSKPKPTPWDEKEIGRAIA